jgi:Niemann-Pick C1 protein
VTIVVLFSFLFPVLSFAVGRVVIESNIDTLIVPLGSYPLAQKEWVLENFGVVERSAALIHANGNNVISEEAVSLAFDVADAIPTLADYERWCITDTCDIQSVANFWGSREDFESNMLSLVGETDKYEYILDTLSATTYPNGTPVTRELVFGYHKADTNGRLISAVSFLIAVQITPSAKSEQADFESDFGTALQELSIQSSSTKANLESFTTTTMNENAREIINQDIPLVFTSIIFMSLFTAVAMTRWGKNTKNQRFVTSNFALGLGATATIVLSAITGYGFCTLCGFPVTYMTQMLPFVLFGIGIDDSFVLIGAYYETNPMLPFKGRIREMAHLAAPSITATTLTDIVAFALGSISTIPVVRWFCFYAAVCVFIDYIYQITFFVALLVIDHDRAKAGRYDLLCCCFRAPEPELDDEESCDIPQRQAVIPHQGVPRTTISVREVRPSSRSIIKLYTDVLFVDSTRIFVLLLFTALFVIGVIYASKVTVDFSERDLSPSDSQSNRFAEAFDSYYEESVGQFHGQLYFHDIDFSNADVRQQMVDFRQDILSLGADSYPQYPTFAEDFDLFLTETFNSTNGISFTEQLDGFFNITAYQLLHGDTVIRDESSGSIDRVMESITIAHQLSSGSLRVSLLSEQPLNAASTTVPERMFYFNKAFPLFEHLRVLPRELLIGLSLSIVAVALVSLIFTPHPTCVLLSVVIVVMVDVEVLGIIYLTGSNLEPSSMAVLIMSIGLVVDYCLHIMHSYLHVDSVTRSGRAKLAVQKIGGSVSLGGLTTFLGVSVLAFSSGAIFFKFFVLFSSMVALGVGHGLVFLPVVLSYIGPEFVAHRDESSKLIPASSHLSMRSVGHKSVVLLRQEENDSLVVGFVDRDGESPPPPILMEDDTLDMFSEQDFSSGERPQLDRQDSTSLHVHQSAAAGRWGQ